MSLLPLFKVDTVKKKIVNNLHFWISKKVKRICIVFFLFQILLFFFFVKLSKSWPVADLKHTFFRVFALWHRFFMSWTTKRDFSCHPTLNTLLGFINKLQELWWKLHNWRSNCFYKGDFSTPIIQILCTTAYVWKKENVIPTIHYNLVGMIYCVT